MTDIADELAKLTVFSPVTEPEIAGSRTKAQGFPVPQQESLKGPNEPVIDDEEEWEKAELVLPQTVRKGRGTSKFKESEKFGVYHGDLVTSTSKSKQSPYSLQEHPGDSFTDSPLGGKPKTSAIVARRMIASALGNKDISPSRAENITFDSRRQKPQEDRPPTDSWWN